MISKANYRRLPWLGLAAGLLLIPHGLLGQLQPSEQTAWVGDTPATAPPLATDLSPELTRKNVRHAMKKSPIGS